MVDKAKCTVYSGGMKGAEAAFGEMAEKWNITEVNFSYDGHIPERDVNIIMLADEDLKRGDISMELASKLMKRTYYQKKKIRKVLQSIFHMVNSGYQVFAVGFILDDKTVKGGTGWAVELAKLFNRPVSVYDQGKKQWFTWQDNNWQEDSPVISYETITGSGTRHLSDEGRQAIEQLFIDSFGEPS